MVWRPGQNRPEDVAAWQALQEQALALPPQERGEAPRAPAGPPMIDLPEVRVQGERPQPAPAARAPDMEISLDDVDKDEAMQQALALRPPEDFKALKAAEADPPQERGEVTPAMNAVIAPPPGKREFAQASAPISAASEEHPEYGPPPTPRWQTALANLPTHIANLAIARSIPKSTGTTIGNQTIQGNLHDIRSSEEGATRDRLAYGKRQAYLDNRAKETGKAAARQASQDAISADERGRRHKAEDAAAAAAAQDDDPNSTKNVLFRKTLATTYPDLQERYTPEEWGSLTVKSNPATQIAIEGEKSSAALKHAGAAREQSKQDKIDVYMATKGKSRGGGGVGFASPIAAAADSKSNADALAAQYGGADKVPPEVKRRLALAESLKGPKRTAAVSSIMKDAGKDSAPTGSEFKERREYQNQSASLREANRTMQQIDDIFAKNKVNTTTGKGDVPGFGKWTALPGADMVQRLAGSEDGTKLRRHVKNLVSQLVLARSGKAATDPERKTLADIYGSGEGMSDEQLLDALKVMRGIMGRTQGDLDAAYPDAAATAKANHSAEDVPEGVRGPKNASAPAGTVRMKAPEGHVEQVPADKVEEAKKAGYVNAE